MNILSAEQGKKLLNILKVRFEENKSRHQGIEWAGVQKKLEADAHKLWSLNEMETSGGAPDVVSYDKETHIYTFCDCSSESPAGRRNLCYDHAALESRKKNKPQNSAVDMALFMGIELLTAECYQKLQELGEFDTKTSSWIATPDEIRKRGGALFCDRRYDHVFVYHNSAESYYAVRGFRGMLKV